MKREALPAAAAPPRTQTHQRHTNKHDTRDLPPPFG